MIYYPLWLFFKQNQVTLEVGQIRLTVINDCMDVVPLVDLKLTDFRGKVMSISPEVMMSFGVVD